MITVVIDHTSWHEAQQEHTDNHNLNGGGCHYQSGFGLVMALITNPRDQPGPLPNVLDRRSTGHATEYVAGMSEVV